MKFFESFHNLLFFFSATQSFSFEPAVACLDDWRSNRSKIGSLVEIDFDRREFTEKGRNFLFYFDL